MFRFFPLGAKFVANLGAFLGVRLGLEDLHRVKDLTFCNSGSNTFIFEESKCTMHKDAAINKRLPECFSTNKFHDPTLLGAFEGVSDLLIRPIYGPCQGLGMRKSVLKLRSPFGRIALH